VSVPFPEPTAPRATRADTLLGYLDYFRDQLVTKVGALPATDQRASRVPSGWTPLELLRHLTNVERRWFVWGFAGEPVADPWADQRDGRWFVPDGVGFDELAAALGTQAARTRDVVTAHDLADVGAPGPRWDGAPPPTLERVLLHVLQEYARHVGQLDIVTEQAGGPTGE
jgi:uncharacterized damage-inducible protein DinB